MWRIGSCVRVPAKLRMPADYYWRPAIEPFQFCENGGGLGKSWEHAHTPISTPLPAEFLEGSRFCWFDDFERLNSCHLSSSIVWRPLHYAVEEYLSYYLLLFLSHIIKLKMTDKHDLIGTVTLFYHSVAPSLILKTQEIVDYYKLGELSFSHERRRPS